MLTVQIQAWDYTPGVMQDTKAEPTFNRTLDDQKFVSRLCEQFNQLDRGVVAHGPVGWVNRCKYRYLFRFFVDDYIQVYQGLDHALLWLYSDQGHRMDVAAPGDILRDLHESIGLPWELPR